MAGCPAGVYDCLEKWQTENQKRLLSISIQPDAGGFCCIALTNPTEVVITDETGRWKVSVSSQGELHTYGAVLGI